MYTVRGKIKVRDTEKKNLDLLKDKLRNIKTFESLFEQKSIQIGQRQTGSC